MLNFIGFSVVGFFLGNFFAVDSGALNQSTPPLPESGQMPGLNWIFTTLGFTEPKGTELQGFLIIAILIGIGYYMLVWKTRFGFDLRASGQNPGAATSTKKGTVPFLKGLISCGLNPSKKGTVPFCRGLVGVAGY